MTHKLLVLGSTVLFFAACAGSTLSAGRANDDASGAVIANIAADSDSASARGIDLEVVQTAAPPVMGNVSSVDVQYTFEVKNQGTVPTTVRRITIWSAGGAYDVETKSRTFKKTIAPGATAKFPFWARAIGVSSLTGTNAPVTLRAELQLEEGDATRKATFVRTVNGHLTVGVSGQ
jgi:hypothetical protein